MPNTQTLDRARRPALPSLTGLRWSAALLVFLYHVSVVEYFGGQPESYANWAFGAGDVGVSFFFVLSGFVLAWSTTPKVRATEFWHKRIARVYPLHLVTAVLALLLAFTLAPATKPTLGQLLTNLTLTQSWVSNPDYYQSVNPVSWSLACEAFFYFLFPAFIYLMRRLDAWALRVVAAGCLALEFLLPAIDHRISSPAQAGFLLYYFPLERLPEFVLGIALARLVIAGRWRGPSMATSLAITIVGYFLTYQVHPDYRYEACTAIGIACLIASVALADLRDEPSPWRSPRAVKLGELSFAFYMIHLLVMRTGEYVFRSHPREGWIFGSMAAAVAFLVSLALAWLLHNHVEKPLRRLVMAFPGTRRPAPPPLAEGTAAAAALARPGRLTLNSPAQEPAPSSDQA